MVSERPWVRGVAIPSPRPPDRAPLQPAPPPTRPRAAQEPSERPREATDPGEAPRGAARRPGARLAHRPSQPARACGPGRTCDHSDPAGLPAPDVQRAPPARAGRRALPAALQRTFSPPGWEEAARPASSAGRVPSRPGGDARAQRRRRGRARTRVNPAGAAGTRGGADTRGRGHAGRSPPHPRVPPARRSAAAPRRPAQGRPEPGPPLDHRRTPARPAAGKVEPLLTGCPGARPPPAIAARRPRRRPPLPRRGAAEAAQAAQAEAAAPGLRCVAAAAAQHEWGARRADADRPRSRRPRSAARMRRPGGRAGAGPARGAEPEAASRGRSVPAAGLCPPHAAKGNAAARSRCPGTGPRCGQDPERRSRPGILIGLWGARPRRRPAGWVRGLERGARGSEWGSGGAPGEGRGAGQGRTGRGSRDKGRRRRAGVGT